MRPHFAPPYRHLNASLVAHLDDDESRNDPRRDSELHSFQTFQTFKSSIVAPKDLSVSLQDFPRFVHPITKEELYSVARAAIENATTNKLLCLMCPTEDTEVYMEDLVVATAKSLNANFLKVQTKALFEFLGDANDVTFLSFLSFLSFFFLFFLLLFFFFLEVMGFLLSHTKDWEAQLDSRGRRKPSAAQSKKSVSLAHVVRQLSLAVGESKLIIFLEDMSVHMLTMKQIQQVTHLLEEIMEENVILVGCQAISQNLLRNARPFMEDSFPGRENRTQMVTTINVLPPQDPKELEEWAKFASFRKKTVVFELLPSLFFLGLI